jgi:hypothetical protein
LPNCSLNCLLNSLLSTGTKVSALKFDFGNKLDSNKYGYSLPGADGSHCFVYECCLIVFELSKLFLEVLEVNWL